MRRRGLGAGVTLLVVAVGAAGGSFIAGGSPAGAGCDQALAAPASSAVERRLDCRRVCQAGALIPPVAALPSGRGVGLRIRGGSRRAVRVAVYRLTRGRRVIPNRLVTSFGRRGRSFKWSGRVRGRPVRSGYYEVRFRSGREVRLVALRRRAGRFTRLPAFQRPRQCDGLSAYRLGGPAVGGSGRQPLSVLYRLGAPGRVSVVVKRGRRTIRRFSARSRAPGQTYRLRFRTRARGTVRVVLTARLSGGRTVRSQLTTRGL